MTIASADEEQLEISYIAVGTENGTGILEKFDSFLELNIKSPYNPVISFLVTDSKNEQTGPHKDLFMNVYSSFILMGKNWKQPKCPSTGER